MAHSAIIVVVYVHGRISNSEEGVIFEGTCKVIKIKRGITFDSLKNRIHEKVKLQSN